MVDAFAEAANFVPHQITREHQYLVNPDEKELKKVQGGTVAVWYQPLEEIGGDFYDVNPISERKTGILVGDSMGHGIKAALYSHLIQPVARLFSTDHATSPDVILKKMNSLLYRSRGPMRLAAFATAQYAIVTNTDTSKYLVYANAGHPHPILCRNREAKYITENNIFAGNNLGMVDDERLCLFEHCIELQSGDFIVFYSDGIVEVMNENREQYLTKLLEILSQEFSSPEDVIDKVKQDVSNFCREVYQDDITLLVFHVW